MEYETVHQTVSRVFTGNKAVRFDANNPLHRSAYATWELTGKWTIRFLTEWPYVTVPQTIMSALSRRACRDEFNEVATKLNIDLKPGFESYFFRKSA